jgi:uncharacterized protein (TIGR03000 family)
MPAVTSPVTYGVPANYSVPSYQNVPSSTTTDPVDLRSGTSSAPATYGRERQASAAPAKLNIELPVDAKLYVDGQLTTSTTETRIFTTPALQGGLTYFYDLKAEISRDGVTHTESKRVIVRSGDSIRTSFAVLEAELKGSVMTTTAAK